jgi:O-glycosyl hydrolase
MNKRPALAQVKLSGAENGDLRFFNKSYIRILLGDPLVRARLDGVDTHSYRVAVPWLLAGVKPRYRRWMDKHYPGVPLKTSEWTHMQGGRDYGMGSALEQARVMAEDLSVLQVTSWQHWVAVSDVDYCDGLIYIDEKAHTYDIPKRYYAFGNFTKFIPRGAVRVEATAQNTPEGLTLLAFLTPDGQTVLVTINHAQQPLTLSLEGAARAATLFVTSETQNLEEQAVVSDNISLPAQSVCTLVL